MTVATRVDTNISDLFFNTEHKYNGDEEITAHEDAYCDLRQEATDFLASLDRLGVPVPTVEELMADFFERL